MALLRLQQLLQPAPRPCFRRGCSPGYGSGYRSSRPLPHCCSSRYPTAAAAADRQKLPVNTSCLCAIPLPGEAGRQKLPVIASCLCTITPCRCRRASPVHPRWLPPSLSCSFVCNSLVCNSFPTASRAASRRQHGYVPAYCSHPPGGSADAEAPRPSPRSPRPPSRSPPPSPSPAPAPPPPSPPLP